MIKSNSTFVFREAKNNNFPKSEIVAPGEPDSYLIQGGGNIAKNDMSRQLLIQVLESAGGDPTHLFIGDTVVIGVNDVRGTFWANTMSVPSNELVFSYGPTDYYKTILSTANSYYDGTKTPALQGPDVGKPICLDTAVYPLQVEKTTPKTAIAGYWVPAAINSKGYYTVSATAVPTDPKTISFFLIPIDVTSCVNGACSPSDISNWTVTCDSNCNCTDQKSNAVFTSADVCKCSTPLNPFYGCCPLEGCVQVNNPNGLTQSDCKSLCVGTNTLYGCNGNGYCVPMANGK